MAVIVASVPEEVMRSISTLGTRRTTSAASATSPGGRRAEARAARGGLLDRGEDLRVRVPVDQRPPRADVVHEAVAVDVDQFGALAALDEDRLAPDRAHRAHGRVDPPGSSSSARR